MVWRTLALAALLSCSSYRDVEHDNGWAGIELAKAVSDYPTMTELRAKDARGDAIYTRPEEQARWGKAKISVRYFAWNDVIWQIQIQSGSSRKLLDAIEAEYGTPSFKKPWHWEGPTVRMKFQGNEHDSLAVATITHKPTEQAREAAKPKPTPRPPPPVTDTDTPAPRP